MPHRTIAAQMRIRDEQIETLRQRRRELETAIELLEKFQRESFVDLLRKIPAVKKVSPDGSKLVLAVDNRKSRTAQPKTANPARATA